MKASSIPPLDIDRRLNSKDVENLTGRHRQTVWRYIKAGTFPKPDYIHGLRSWPESAIRDWVDNQLESFESREQSRQDTLSAPPPKIVRRKSA